MPSEDESGSRKRKREHNPISEYSGPAKPVYNNPYNYDYPIEVFNPPPSSIKQDNGESLPRGKKSKFTDDKVEAMDWDRTFIGSSGSTASAQQQEDAQSPPAFSLN